MVNLIYNNMLIHRIGWLNLLGLLDETPGNCHFPQAAIMPGQGERARAC